MSENERTAHKGEPTAREGEDRTQWPWPAQFLLAVIALATAVVLLIWIPMRVAPGLAGGGSGGAAPDLSMMMAVFIGLTTMTISGIFLFMTFRIDRGTRMTAQRVAQEVGKAEAKEVAREEMGELVNKKFAEMWGDHVVEGIEKEKRKLDGRIEGMSKELDTQAHEFLEKVGKLEGFKGRADRVVSDLETEKSTRIQEMEGIKKQAEGELRRMGEEGKRTLEAIREQAGKEIREASARVVKAVEEAEGGAVKTVEEARGGAVKTVEEAREAAAGAVRLAGKNVRDGIRDTEREQWDQVEKAGTDARKRIEREMTGIVEDARRRIDQHVQQIDQQVKQIADQARARIAEADIERLVKERAEPYLQGLTARRGLFGPRPREPRS